MTCLRLLKEVIVTVFRHHQKSGKQIVVKFKQLWELMVGWKNKAPDLDDIPNRVLKLK